MVVLTLTIKASYLKLRTDLPSMPPSIQQGFLKTLVVMALGRHYPISLGQPKDFITVKLNLTVFTAVYVPLKNYEVGQENQVERVLLSTSPSEPQDGLKVDSFLLLGAFD